ncbi:MAG: hypothetical protein IJW72_06700 [Alphaproteobacteria bacterium]|nr:hypothetical protein [Alphaproteobacteria bacterium]MBQ7285921.1 hypothetical protein [Alphaproteobacteria bacterium]
MRIVLLSLVFSMMYPFFASAQYAAQNDAKYIATLKAVVNYKIEDEENLSAVEHLREDQRFNRQLLRMLDKLQNTRTKNSTNKRIYDILLRAGKEVYNELK